MKKNLPKLIVIVGPNASGKSGLGFELAKVFNGEIISADSRQVYKYLDLSTGKVTKEEMAEVKHHLIDVADLNTTFSLADFQELAYKAIDDIISRGKVPFLVGGTGLYTRAVAEGYGLDGAAPNWEIREELESKPNEELLEILKNLGCELPLEINRRRIIRQIEKLQSGAELKVKNEPKYEVLQLGLNWERDELRERIKLRLDQRLNNGMLDEMKAVIERGASGEFLKSLGCDPYCLYKYLKGEYKDYTEFYNDILTKDCQLAKRQRTWYRKEKNIIWLEGKSECFKEASKLINKFLKIKGK